MAMRSRFLVRNGCSIITGAHDFEEKPRFFLNGTLKKFAIKNFYAIEFVFQDGCAIEIGDQDFLE